jgi:hypothetical protein
MLKIIFVRLLCTVCGRRPRYRSTGRILAFDFYKQRNLFPWVLGLKKRERYECSATLISESWLLTGAHCVVRYNSCVIKIHGCLRLCRAS